MVTYASHYLFAIIGLLCFLLIPVCARNSNMPGMQIDCIELSVFAVGLTAIFIRILVRFRYVIDCKIKSN